MRRKISEGRIRYLRDHPEMVPYKLNHKSKGRSFPERYWGELLKKYGLEFVEQFQESTYTLDFAFLDRKIDLEIDGEQHYVDPRIVSSDQRRNAFLEGRGWKIVRVRWSKYQQLSGDDREKFVTNLVESLTTG